MVKTEEKAQQVNLTFAPMIDPTIIILIIEIIIQVIKWYIECNMKSDKALPSIQKPGWLYRWYLRRLVKQVLTKGNKQHLQE